jgi:hypothetical protein
MVLWLGTILGIGGIGVCVVSVRAMLQDHDRREIETTWAAQQRRKYTDTWRSPYDDVT